MNVHIFPADEFEDLDTENDQMRELFFLYGTSIVRFTSIDEFLGMSIRDFQEKYETSPFDALLNDLLEGRNKLDHITLKWSEVPLEASRITIYEELLEIYKSLDNFDNSVKGKKICTKKNADDCITYAGNAD
jgi:hypothetical protein